MGKFGLSRSSNTAFDEVTYLGKKFILYLAQAHKEKESEIKHLINLGGGYFIHLDSTCDGDSPHLFCAIEELLRLVLVARKIPSESCESIVPKLPEELTAHLLIEWIQNYTDDLDGYGFPFDRANVSLVDRMIRAYEYLQKLNSQECTHLMKIQEFLKNVLDCRDLQDCLRDLKRRIRYFEWLRNIMKIAPSEGADGLNDDGENADMSLMKKALNAFTAREDIKNAAEMDRCVRKMLAQIEKYKDRLFTDGVEVIDARGNKVLIHCERTNNIAERAFRDEKRGHRKRTGNKSMRK